MNKPLIKSARLWIDHLQEERGLKGLLDQAKSHERLTDQVKNALIRLGFEQWSPLIMVEWKATNPNELFLLVASPTIAARLQQITPSLLKELKQYQWSISNLKVRVRPNPVIPQAQSHSAPPPPFTDAAQQAWQTLYERLLPNSSIRNAVGQLLKGRKTKR